MLTLKRKGSERGRDKCEGGKGNPSVEESDSYLDCAENILQHLDPLADDSMEDIPMEFAHLARHGDREAAAAAAAASLHRPVNFEAFSTLSASVPKLPDVVTPIDISKSAVRMAHLIRKAVHGDLIRRKDPGHALGGSFLGQFFQESADTYEKLRGVLNRPEINKDIGALILNGQLAMFAAWRKDIANVRKSVRHCVEIFDTFPGASRSQSGLHTIHSVASVLATLAEESLYERVRNTHSRMWKGEKPIPPLGKWEGVHGFCNHYFCESMEHLYPENWHKDILEPSTELQHASMSGSEGSAEASWSSYPPESDMFLQTLASLDEAILEMPSPKRTRNISSFDDMEMVAFDLGIMEGVSPALPHKAMRNPLGFAPGDPGSHYMDEHGEHAELQRLLMDSSDESEKSDFWSIMKG